MARRFTGKMRRISVVLIDYGYFFLRREAYGVLVSTSLGQAYPRYTAQAQSLNITSATPHPTARQRVMGVRRISLVVH